MVDEGLSSEAEALEPSLASVIDAERARLLTIGERRQQLGFISSRLDPEARQVRIAAANKLLQMA
jgi:hypothetical protein